MCVTMYIYIYYARALYIYIYKYKYYETNLTCGTSVAALARAEGGWSLHLCFVVS